MNIVQPSYRFLFVFFLFALVFVVNAQKKYLLTAEQASSKVEFAESVIVDETNVISQIKYQESTPFASITSLKKSLSLPKESDLIPLKSTDDHLGFEHHKYNQSYNGDEIVGGQLIFHCAKGMVKTATGKIYQVIEVDTQPAISEALAFDIAKEKIGATTYLWEDESNVSTLKKISEESFEAPKAKLVISKEKYTNTSPFRLVYQFDIYATDPLGRYNVEVDAKTGEIINFFSNFHHASVVGTGLTLYDGEVEITMDSDGSEYRLIDETRGNGIYTYDMDNWQNYSYASIFNDDDGVFDGPNQAAGVSAHFGAAATYDYFLQKHGRNSFDDNGAAIHSYVHYSSGFFNAFWDGYRVTYGDGDGVNTTPLVSLDVVAHEITHGVTQHSANLIYAYESGALNESFSDIFGQAVEFEAFPSSASWNLADQAFTDGTSMIRSMSDPNSQGDPDTYKGDFWYYPDWHGTGVHTNSGVMNYWFYLLCEGGSGTNDNGYNYRVPAIGIEAAEQIAYRNLTVYLTAASEYVDARIGSEFAAIDLFGEDSPEHLAVQQAWDAVGVSSIEPLMAVTNLTTYGDVPVGFAQEQYVKITNQGSALLVVNTISSNSTIFEVSKDNLSIPALSSAIFTITYTPPNRSTHEAAISLQSNGGDATVIATGQGVSPPVSSGAPNNLSETLKSGGQSNQIITLSNLEGESQLFWEVSILYEKETSTSADPDLALYADESRVVQNQLYEETFFKSEVQSFTSEVERSSGLLIEGDTMYILKFDGFVEKHYIPTESLVESIPIHYGAFGIVKAFGLLWIGDGAGNIFGYDLVGNVQASFSSPHHTYNALAFDGKYFIVSDIFSSRSIDKVKSDGTVMESYSKGLSISQFNYVNGQLWGVYGRPGQQGKLYQLFLDEGVITLKEEISISSNTDLYALGHQGNTLLALDWEGEYYEQEVMGWLSVSKNRGRLPAGSEELIEVLFDASGLYAGTYESIVQFTSNDPVNSLWDVPVTLDVEGEPELAFSKADVDFGAQFVGYSSFDTLIISNEGTDILSISSIVASSERYELNASQLAIAPGESYDLVISYLPVAVEENNSSITFLTNDLDEEIVTINLIGSGIEPPVVSIEPATFSATLHTGEQVAYALTLDNSKGASELAWRASAEYFSPSLSEVIDTAGTFVQLNDSPAPLTAVATDQEGNIYARQPDSRAFFRYDISSESWTGLTSYPYENSENGAAVWLDNKIYTSYAGRPEMGIYDILNDSWGEAEMLTHSNNIATDGRFIYYAYGIGLYRYDPVANTNSRLALSETFFGYSGGGLEYYDGYLYGHGGNNDISFSRYHISTDTWERLPNLPEGALQGSAIDAGAGKYYAYGGRNELSWYEYDIEERQWTSLPLTFFEVSKGGMVYYPDKAAGIYFVQGELGNGFAKYVVDPFQEWVSMSEYSGLIPAGASETVEVSFSAEAMLGGDYQAVINLVSNDPINPLLEIQAALEVVAAPDILVSKSSVDFGFLPVAGAISDTITILNRGVTLLSISEISVNDPHFVIDTASIDVGSDETFDLVVTYLPTSVETNTAELRILSNDPDQGNITVQLSGSGARPPSIDVSPGTISRSLFTRQTSSESLLIDNTEGQMPLDWDLVVSYDAPLSYDDSDFLEFEELPSGPESKAFLVTDKRGNIYLQERDRRGFYKYSVIDNEWIKLASSPLSSSRAGSAAILNGKIYVHYDRQEEFGVYDIALDSWSLKPKPVNISGNQLAADDRYLYFFASNAPFSRFDPVSNSLKSLAPPTATVRNGGLVHCNGYIYAHFGGLSGEDSPFLRYRVSTNTWERLVDVPGETYASSTIDEAEGKYYVQGSDASTDLLVYDISLQEWSTVPIPLFDNTYRGAVVYHGGQKPGIYLSQGLGEPGFARYGTKTLQNWLEVSERSGTVAPGETSVVEVVLDANDAHEDTFYGSLLISSNDPLNSLEEVSVTLETTAAPDISISSTTLDFGELLVGNSTQAEVMIVNEGSELLRVSAITVDNEDYELSSSTLDLEPGAGYLLLIDYAPTSALSDDAQLIISSDDPDEQILEVSLVGSGLQFPVFSMGQTSITETLSVGDSNLYTVSIGNLAADADLIWEASIELLSTPATNGSSSGRFNNSTAIPHDPKLFYVEIPTGQISEVDEESGRLIRSITLPPFTGGTNGLAYDGLVFYFSNQGGRSGIYKLDALSGDILETKDFSDFRLNGLTHSGQYLYGVDNESGVIVKMDYENEEVVNILDIGRGLDGPLAYGGSRGTLFVSNGWRIFEVDAITGEVLDDFQAPGDVVALSYSDALSVLFVSNLDRDRISTVKAVDPNNGNLLYQVAPEAYSALTGDEMLRTEWVSLSSYSGSISGNTSEQIQIKVKGVDNILSGTYQAAIHIKSNDPNSDGITIPVFFEQEDRVLGEVSSGTSIYPNPTEGLLTISTAEEVIDFVILDASGKKVNGKISGADQRHQLDLSENLPGVYFIQLIHTDGSVSNHKILMK